ncbi:MAG: two-component regulator propeller domain-containing protein [Bacteroidota bacterium]
MKRCIDIVLILLLLLVPVTASMGQLPNYPVRKFTAEHGLQYVIAKIAQDTRGFVWLMYFDKIQRFDGKHTDTYFEGEKLRWLFVDTQDNVWVTTQKGIFRFDRESGRFLKTAIEGTARSVIVFEPEQGQLFCISASGLYVYDEVLKRFLPSKAPSHQLNPEVQVYFHKFSYVNHTLYYSAGDTIWHHDMQTGSADKLPVRNLRSILALSEQEIVVNTWEHKAWYYNFKTRKRLRLSMPDTDPFLLVSDIVAVDKTTHYLATSKGILAYTAGTEHLQRISLSFDGKPLPVNEYTALYKGKGGIIWGRNHRSLLSFNPFGAHISFIQGHDMNSDYRFNSSVRNFAEDKRGNLWLATTDGLAYWDMENDRFSTIEAKEDATDRLNHASIRGLVYDDINLIIGQTDKGIWIFDPETGIYDRPKFEDSEKGRLLKEKLEQSFIHQIKTLKNGNHIVAAREGAYLISGDHYTVETVEFPGGDLHTKFTYQDSEGNIFIGTTKGLYCFDATLAHQYTLKDPLANPSVNCMLAKDDGYYLGTQRGLYFFSVQENGIAIKKAIPMLENQEIRTLFTDRKNRLWIVTKSKLHQYFPETGQMNTYGYSEHIRGGSFYRNSYIRKSDGQVFLGALNGINYFYPESIDIHPAQLAPYIRDIHIREFPDSITSFEAIRHLKRHQNTISINFSTPYYGNPDAISYRYQLTENGEWFNHDHQSNVTLWRLPPGDYQFRIAATLYDGVWHASGESLHFTILPPFWKTWWFNLTITVLGCGVLYSVFSSFQRKLKTERLLNAFNTSLYGYSTVDNILRDVAGNCVKKLGFSACMIYELDKKKNTLLQKAVAGSKSLYDEDIVGAVEIPVGKSIPGFVAVSGKSQVKNTEKGNYEIVVPIWIDGEIFGIMDSKRRGSNFYVRYYMGLLEKTAGICGDRIQRYLTEEKLRGKIARDLHDEMGSTLTSIHIISKMSERKVQDMPIKNQLTKISRYTSGMMEKMSDMVWVVNPANDGLDKLIHRIREHAVEVLEPQQMGLSFKDIENARYIKLNPEQRKNIYLIAKEAINNAIKYSNASKVGIRFEEENSGLKMHILDNGKGYNPAESYSGNGIKNMHVRAEEIGATLQINTAPGKGVLLLLTLAVESIQSI